MTYHAHLTGEHARTLHSVLEEAEAEIAREIMHAAGRLPEDPKLGHAGDHTPKLALGDYLAGEAQPPAMVHRGLFKGYSDILGNDTLGDCGEAMEIHGVEGMRHAAGTGIPPFTRQDAVVLYEQVGGYVPGDPSTDRGTDNSVLIDDWTCTGVKCAADGSVHRIFGSIAVDATSAIECQIAIYEFAALFCAVNLPLTAQGQRTWDVAGDGRTGNAAPGSWGGHDVVALAYTRDELDVNTWGAWTPMTAAFRLTYQAGFFAVVAPDMLSRRGVSPSGVNYDQLLADLRKL